MFCLWQKRFGLYSDHYKMYSFSVDSTAHLYKNLIFCQFNWDNHVFQRAWSEFLKQILTICWKNNSRFVFGVRRATFERLFYSKVTTRCVRPITEDNFKLGDHQTQFLGEDEGGWDIGIQFFGFTDPLFCKITRSNYWVREPNWW